MLKKDIARRIEEFFISRGWTKAKFADIIGIKAQHVNKVFSAELDPLRFIDALVENGADRNYLLLGGKQDKTYMNKLIELEKEIDHLNNKLAAYEKAARYITEAGMSK